MTTETEAILYRRNTRLYPNWAGVCSSGDDEPIEVHGDVPPVDDEQFVIALTPGVIETTPWEEREALAAAVADAGAAGLVDSWWAFAEKTVTMDANGDVWA